MPYHRFCSPNTKNKLLQLSVDPWQPWWLWRDNLADIGEKDKNIILDSLVLPSELFSKSFEIEVGKFQKAMVYDIKGLYCAGPEPSLKP